MSTSAHLGMIACNCLGPPVSTPKDASQHHMLPLTMSTSAHLGLIAGNRLGPPVSTPKDASQHHMLPLTMSTSAHLGLIACNHLGSPVSTPKDASQHHMLPLTMNEVLLRGCTLRNSKWVLGLVIYAGPDTRIQVSPFKQRCLAVSGRLH